MLSEVRDLRQKRSVVATLPSGDTCGQPRLQHAFLFPVSPFKMIVMARWGGGGGRMPWIRCLEVGKAGFSP